APSEHAIVQRAISPGSRPGPARLALSVQRVHEDDGGVERVRSLRRTLLILLVGTLVCHACSLAPGHFHPVTAMRGRVVGKNFGPFGFRWLGQVFEVKGATRVLYEYHLSNLVDLPKIASLKTDEQGAFDFGPTPKGHYFLKIIVENSDRLGGLFEVE